MTQLVTERALVTIAVLAGIVAIIVTGHLDTQTVAVMAPFGTIVAVMWGVGHYTQVRQNAGNGGKPPAGG